jgi:hypothetical protein
MRVYDYLYQRAWFHFGRTLFVTTTLRAPSVLLISVGLIRVADKHFA